ncbi:MAG: hypothetical protein IT178_14465 [Acidobacteria bacterium]|nr:hypothetical protein [Acidobacteriota bacterium]
MTAFHEINDAIADFVNAPANRRLRAGTGAYSALFRGGLFGQDRSVDVARQLPSQSVKVLWMGMNPNVPGSLQHILADAECDGDYPSFELQRASGY